MQGEQEVHELKLAAHTATAEQQELYRDRQKKWSQLVELRQSHLDNDAALEYLERSSAISRQRWKMTERDNTVRASIIQDEIQYLYADRNYYGRQQSISYSHGYRSEGVRFSQLRDAVTRDIELYQQTKRQLIEEIKAAKQAYYRGLAQYHSHQKAQRAAKKMVDAATLAYEKSSSAVEEASRRMNIATADYDKARAVFTDSLYERRFEIARTAEVPEEYLDPTGAMLTLSYDPDERKIHVYYHKQGMVLDPTHGHNWITWKGVVGYRRLPNTPRGSHNYRDPAA